MWRTVALASVIALGCGAEIEGEKNRAGTDAAAPAPDAETVANPMPDAPPASACPNSRKVYLAFEGVTLTAGTPSDAVQNRVSWMGNANAVVPAYAKDDPARTQYIQTITAGVRQRLQGTPIEVVDQRPATGPYVMVVFGGTSAIVGTIYDYATNEHDCGDVVKNDVAWVADSSVVNVSYAQDLAVGAIGWGLGLNGTNDPMGCMCAWANGCQSVAGACMLSSSIATTISAAPATTCPNQNPQNEIAAFSTGFCQ